MRPKANNFIVLVEFPLKFPSKKRFQFFLVWELASRFREFEQTELAIWHFQLCATAYQFLSNISSFLNSRNSKCPPFSLPWNFVSSFASKHYFKTLAKRWNVGLESTTPSYCTLTADSVQWLSQSDYSICISILVEFY